MTVDPTSTAGSSTSRTTPSRSSRRSARGSARSASAGDAAGPGEHGGLTRTRLRELAQRYDVRPSKALGQHFLADRNLARAIVRDAGVEPGDRVLEIGAGFGSLTVALAEAGAEVLAVEVDRRLAEALREVTDGLPVQVVEADAVTADWGALLGRGRWVMVSNLPYNVAVPVVMHLLEGSPRVGPFTVMVQREVGERLAAGPGDDAYGAVSARRAYRATAALVRRVPRTVFWPEPGVDSAIVRLERIPPPVRGPADRLFRVVEEGFAQRRKTMRNALVRLGLSADDAARALEACGIDPRARAEELGLPELACLARRLPAR